MKTNEYSIPGVKIIHGEGTIPHQIKKIYPSNILYIKYAVSTLLIWGVLGAVFAFFSFLIGLDTTIPQDFAEVWWGIFWVVGLVVFVPALILSYFYVQTMEFIVHGDEIIVAKGIFNRTIKYCPFRTVTNISSRAGPLDRIFGIGNIHVQTAGKSGAQGGPEEKLEGLPLYREIRDYIIKELRAYDASSKSGKLEPTISEDQDVIYKEYLNEIRELKEIIRTKKR
ncbi:MAG: PH domain-containing protein [Candidatus Thorarchaeota archaeon]